MANLQYVIERKTIFHLKLMLLIGIKTLSILFYSLRMAAGLVSGIFHNILVTVRRQDSSYEEVRLGERCLEFIEQLIPKKSPIIAVSI